MTVSDVQTESTPITVGEFQRLFSTHPGGVAVITLTTPDGEPAGFTATSVISLSAEPPLAGFSIMNKSSCWPGLSMAHEVIIHFIDADETQLARRFATSGIDRFSGVPWTRTEGGLPQLSEASTWARARIVVRLEAGTSWFIVAELLESAIDDDHAPTVYHGRKFHRLGALSEIS